MIDPPNMAALEALAKTIQENSNKAQARYAPARATIQGGFKCQVKGPSGEHIETDMPLAMGGSAAGPNPGWFFRASFAACCSTVIAMQAARLGIKVTKIEVTVGGNGDQRGLLGLDDNVSAAHTEIRTDVQISAENATPEQLKEVVNWALEHSPVGRTVRDAPMTVVNIVVV
jgi:uncharacterized OsmC-like protein